VWLVVVALEVAACQPANVERNQPGLGGRRIRVDQQAAGPYLLRAITSPDPPQVGQLFVEVRVSDPMTRRVMTDVEVAVSAEPAEGAPLAGGPLESRARLDFAPTPREYAAYLPVPDSGFWRITVTVDGPQGPGELSFLERVAEPSHWIHYLTVVAPFAALAALGYGYLRLRPRAEAPPPN
jgi:hypothetical protein